jgi:FlaA1/EpsC-like NDP-sugar epimerase
MADNTPHLSFRLRSSEHRILLILGDLVASIASDFAAIYTWRLYLYKLLSMHLKSDRAWTLVALSVKIPLWFYLLPLGWLLLMVNLYDPHIAADWRKTLRGIAIAAFIGIVVYSLFFITTHDPNDLPRIGFGAFLIATSLLTLGWRALYIRLYNAPGLMRRVLVIGAGKAGLALARTFNKLNPPPFTLIGFIDDDPHKSKHTFEGFPVMGSSRHLLRVVEE